MHCVLGYTLACLNFTAHSIQQFYTMHYLFLCFHFFDREQTLLISIMTSILLIAALLGLAVTPVFSQNFSVSAFANPPPLPLTGASKHEQSHTHILWSYPPLHCIYIHISSLHNCFNVLMQTHIPTHLYKNTVVKVLTNI